MKLFNLDSPVMAFLGKVADLMILNLLTLICCIPIVTAGAAFTALHYVALKIVRDEETYIVKSYFKSFRQNFRQATVIWLLIMIVGLFIGYDIYIIVKSGIEFHIVFKIIIGIVAVMVLFTVLYVFPVLSKFDNTIKQTIKNAFLMSLMQFPKTLLTILIYLIPVILFAITYKVIPFIIAMGISTPVYGAALLYNKFFQKLEDQINGVNQPEEENPDAEESIFKDEIDESLFADEQIAEIQAIEEKSE